MARVAGSQAQLIDSVRDAQEASVKLPQQQSDFLMRWQTEAFQYLLAHARDAGALQAQFREYQTVLERDVNDVMINLQVSEQEAREYIKKTISTPGAE